MSNAFIDGLGITLARAREGLGLSQAEAASRLKLSPRQIVAIEAEDWAQLPGEVFLRGFVRNYARVLNLRPEDLIRPVDREATTTHTITAPSEGLAFGRVSITRWVTLPLAALLLFLVVVAVLYQWLSQGEQALVSPPPSPVTEVDKPASAPGVVGPTASAPRTEEIGQPLALEPQPIEQLPPPAAPSPPAVFPAPPAAATPPATEPPPPPNADSLKDTTGGNSTLQFIPGEDAWIQVVDGQGQRFSKLVRSGIAEQLKGKPPFKLVVGNAASVKLTYNGHQIDLKPFIGEKVARLTLE